MSSFSEIVRRHAEATDQDIEWLRLLVADWQLLADLAFADLVLWLRDRSGGWSVIAQARPSTWATVFHEDIVGQTARPGLAERLDAAAAAAPWPAEPCESELAAPWREESGWHVDLFPVRQRGRLLGVVVRTTDPGSTRTPGRLELVYREAAASLLRMLGEGLYPYESAPTGPRRGAPRVGDGLIRLDSEGLVTYSSPNAVSAVRRLGIVSLAGRSLAEVVTGSLRERDPVDEALPLVVTGRAPWRCDLEMRGAVLSLRAAPLLAAPPPGSPAAPIRTGAILLVRDVTELRRSERALMTKEATIREIHHRVKNNLQTVSALLRLQSRRSEAPEAREALAQAGRRVAAIAGVYDALARDVDEAVPFDAVIGSALTGVLDIARQTPGSERIKLRREGSFGRLWASDATPLVLVLSELVSNAIEHGYPGEHSPAGEIVVRADRTDDRLVVAVLDDGVGVAEDARPGLGTQIITTLVQSELGGRFERRPREGGGTEAVVDVRLRTAAGGWGSEQEAVDEH